MRMTKKQAEQDFRNVYLPAIRAKEKEYGHTKDIPMRREEWCNYTDMLCKERRITPYQYNNWSYPSFCE